MSLLFFFALQSSFLELNCPLFPFFLRLYSIIEPLTSALPSGYTSSIKSYNWIDSLQQLAGSQKLNTTGQKNTRDDFYTKSLLTPAVAPLTTDVMTKFFNYLWNTKTNNNWFGEFQLSLTRLFRSWD